MEQSNTLFYHSLFIANDLFDQVIKPLFVAYLINITKIERVCGKNNGIELAEKLPNFIVQTEGRISERYACSFSKAFMPAGGTVMSAQLKVLSNQYHLIVT